MKYLIALVVIGLLFYGCEKPPSYSDVPIIQFKSMSANVVRSFTNSAADAQSLPDTMNIQITFTDGNGAIGETSTDSLPDAFLIDNRPTPSGQLAVNPFTIPYITPNGNVKAISGTISFHLSSQLIGRPDSAHAAWDTLHYSIYIVDRNGNSSATIPTPDIYIKDN